MIKKNMSEYIYRLKVNDIRFVICESSRINLSNDELVLSLIIKCGTYNEEISGSQIAHLLEHVSLSFDRFNLDKEVCRVRGKTDFDYTMYTFYGKEHQINYFFDKIEDILCGKYIEHKYINKAMQDIKYEYYNVFLRKNCYTNNINRVILEYYNLIEFLPNSRVDLITTLTAEDILEFKEKWYVDRNIDIIILVPNNNSDILRAITSFCKFHKNNVSHTSLPCNKGVSPHRNKMVRIEEKIVFLLSNCFEDYNKAEIALKIIILSLEMSDCKKYMNNFNLCTVANKYFYIVANLVEDIGTVEEIKRKLIQIIESNSFFQIINNILGELKSSKYQLSSKIDVDFYLKCLMEDVLFSRYFNGAEYKQWQYYQIINSFSREEIARLIYSLFENMEV